MSKTQTTSSKIAINPTLGKAYLQRGDVPKYIGEDYENALMASHMESQIPLMSVGPKGTGKTLRTAAFAHKEKIPIIQFDCSENTKRGDLIGRFVLVGNDVSYQLGVLPTAIETANQCGKAILVLEEMNGLTPSMQKVLNQMLDWRRHIYIPEIGQQFQLDAEAKLLICANLNPASYGGVFDLNEDLVSRFAIEKVDYPKTAKEKKIVNWESIPDDVSKALLTLAKETRAGAKSNETQLEYALSPRDLAMFADVYRAYKKSGIDKVLDMTIQTTILGKYSQDEQGRKYVLERLNSLFDLQAEEEEDSSS